MPPNHMTIKPKTLTAIAEEANRIAGRSTIAQTIAALRVIEERFRDDALRLYAQGINPTPTLTSAANIAEAISLIETHAINQE